MAQVAGGELSAGPRYGVRTDDLRDGLALLDEELSVREAISGVGRAEAAHGRAHRAQGGHGKLLHPVLEGREVGAEHPAEARPLDRRDAGGDLDPLVPQDAAVEDALAEARDRCWRGLHQQIVGVARIPRHFQRGAAMPELCVNAGFEFLHAFWPQVGRTRSPLEHSADVAADDGARGERKLVPKLGQVPDFAVRGPQLELAPLAEQAGEAVRRRRLGEQVVLVGVAEGTRALGAESRRQEQPLL